MYISIHVKMLIVVLFFNNRQVKMIQMCTISKMDLGWVIAHWHSMCYEHHESWA